MIADLDKTLEGLLKSELKGITNLTVSFDTPDDKFQAEVAPPTVDLFLYDVRENRELRDNDVIIERTTAGNHLIATARRAPVRVDCSYLVTAWGKDPKDEHLVLSQVMQALLRYPLLPVEMLQGALVGQEPPLPASALQPGLLQSMGEFWQALGGRLKAALHYTVTIGIDIAAAEAAPVVTEKVLHFGVNNTGE
jgi:Pvc16 N-terminal domain